LMERDPSDSNLIKNPGISTTEICERCDINDDSSVC